MKNNDTTVNNNNNNNLVLNPLSLKDYLLHDEVCLVQYMSTKSVCCFPVELNEKDLLAEYSITI